MMHASSQRRAAAVRRTKVVGGAALGKLKARAHRLLLVRVAAQPRGVDSDARLARRRERARERNHALVDGLYEEEDGVSLDPDAARERAEHSLEVARTVVRDHRDHKAAAVGRISWRGSRR